MMAVFYINHKELLKYTLFHLMDSTLFNFLRPHPFAQMMAKERLLTTEKYKSKKKPCCVCKMTKKYRDNCIMNNDDEQICFSFVEAHKTCLRGKGFRVN